MTARTSISRQFRISVMAAVLIAALTLSACSGGESPGRNGATSSSASESASPTATPTPTPTAVYKPADANGKAQNVPLPELPEAAKAETKEGLEAFAKYWYALMNYAYETGDLAPVESIASPDAPCALCERIFPAVEKWNSDGRWVVGAAIDVHALQSRFTKSATGEYQVTVQSQQREGTLRNADGTVGQTVQETSMLGDLLIARYLDGKWLVINVDRLGG